MAEIIEIEEVKITVVLPLPKIEMYNELVLIQNSALVLLQDADTMRKKYPHTKSHELSYQNILKHVNSVNEALQRTRGEIRDRMRQQIREELWSFIPPF